MIARTAIVFRCTFCVIAPLGAVADGTPPAGAAARNAALGVVLVWGGVVWLTCRRQQRLPAWLVLVDAALFAGMVLGEGALVPEHLVGEGSTWVNASLTPCVLLASWSLPVWAASGVTAAAAGAYLGGVAVAGQPVTVGVGVNVSVLPIQLLLGLVIVQHMRRTAATTDQALMLLDQQERQREVAAARSQAADTRRATLHETVVASLTVVARGGVAAQDRAVHQHALAALVLRRDRAGVPSGDHLPSGTLAARAMEEARLWGLSLRCRHDDFTLPAPVAEAFCAAIGEGLRNVERHAGTVDAELDLAMSAETITATLTDNGVGFTPTAEEPTSIGLRDSVGRRMAAVGGRGVVRSRPGGGTSVVLTWRRAATSEVADSPDPFGSTLPDAYASGFARALTLVPVIWHTTTLLPLMANLHNYRSPNAAISVWLVLAAVGIALVIRHGTVLGQRAATMALIACVVASSAAVALCQGPGLIDKTNWAIGDYGWFLVALLAHRLPPRRVLLAWPVVPIVNAAAIVTVIDDPAPALGHLLNILLFVGYLQFAALAMYWILRNQGAVASEALRRAHQIQTEQAAADAVEADREARYQGVEAELLPFLRGLAEGTIHPSDAARRSEAWVNACLLRAVIEHDRGDVSARTVDRVVAVAGAAARRGLAPTLRLAEIETLPEETADDMTAVMQSVIDSSEPGEARFTLHAHADGATMRARLPSSTAVDELRRVVTAVARLPLQVDIRALRSNTIWLEARWSR